MELQFRPRPIPTTIAVLAVLALIGLGTWQLTRYLEKASIEDRRTELASDEAMEVDSLAAFDDPDNNYRLVRVSGTLDEERVAVFLHKNRNRRAGCWIASPLKLDSGGEVLASRGWLPASDGVRCDPAMADTPDSRTWTGVVHVPDRILKDVATRRADDPQKPWATFDVDGVYQVLGVEERPDRPALLVLDDRHSGDPFPVASTEMIEEPYLSSSTHFSYAFTWYGLIIFVVIIWAVLSARRVDEEDQSMDHV